MSFELVQAVNNLIEAGTRDLFLRVPESETGEYIPPNIFIGAGPLKRKENVPGKNDKSAFPFIVTRLVSGEDTEEDSTIVVNTICGIYTGEDMAAREQTIINLVMRIKRLLVEQHTIEKRFIREGVIKWHMGDIEDNFIQPYPFYGGAIQTVWNVPAYEKLLTLEQEKNIYGEIE